MTPPTSNRKYEQPYSSRHVIHNTKDSIRADDPAYMRNFPRLLHGLYKKQTPFNSTILNTSRHNKSGSRRVGSARSPDLRRPRPSPDGSGTQSLRARGAESPPSTSPVVPAPQTQPTVPAEATATATTITTQQETPAQAQQHNQVGFKTLGRAGKSPAAQGGGLSNMPSDFEHIFHYSETQ